MGLRFWRRERTEQAAANPTEIAELRKQLEEAEAVADAREVLRAKWQQLYRSKCAEYARLHTRTDEAERKLRGVEADLWMRDGQVENQASQIVALETENAELKQSLDGAREQLRQALLEKARAEQAAAVAERLHRERRLA